MNNKCSLNCGTFRGVDKDAYAAEKKNLASIFSLVEYDGDSDLLQLCGARNVAHDPDQLTSIFNTLSTLLTDKGKGQVMLTCDTTEVCFFRRKMWKLMAVHVPEDPFEGLHCIE